MGNKLTQEQIEDLYDSVRLNPSDWSLRQKVKHELAIDLYNNAKDTMKISNYEMALSLIEGRMSNYKEPALAKEQDQVLASLKRLDQKKRSLKSERKVVTPHELREILLTKNFFPEKVWWQKAMKKNEEILKWHRIQKYKKEKC